jgi:hypothetical protein
MAGFEVIIYGRFWVIAEDGSLPSHERTAGSGRPHAQGGADAALTESSLVFTRLAREWTSR